jgi:hypothetical protein
LIYWEGNVTAGRACGCAGGSRAKAMTKLCYSGYRFPPRNHPAGDLALSSVRAELPRCRRFFGRAWDLRFL